MSSQNSISCTVCNGRDFELANGFYYCQTENCGTESRAHGQDFVNEENYPPFTEPRDFGEDPDSNDEEDQMESDNEESVNEESSDEEELMNLENLEQSHFTSDMVKLCA